MKEHSVINITMNYLYSVTTSDTILNEEMQPICYYQFISNQIHLDKYISDNTSLNYKIYLIDNVHSAPQYVIQQKHLDYENCAWLKDTVFVSTNSSVVYNKVIEETIIYANRSHKSLSSTICPCFNTSVYNCNQRHLGTVSPGQILTIKLKVTTYQPYETTIITSFSRTENMPQACHLLNTFEIEQEHHSHQCNEHNYTIWSQKSECELYLTTGKGVTETLYVKLKACPAGFILCREKRICYCDPFLDPYVTSCNLNE